MPIETSAEGSGDCKSVAALVATLLKAGGIGAIVVTGFASNSPEENLTHAGHAMVGVPLTSAPHEVPNIQTYYWLINGTKYYTAEATWYENGPVYDPAQYYSVSSVGQLPWKKFDFIQAYSG